VDDVCVDEVRMTAQPRPVRVAAWLCLVVGGLQAAFYAIRAFFIREWLHEPEMANALTIRPEGATDLEWWLASHMLEGTCLLAVGYLLFVIAGIACLTGRPWGLIGLRALLGVSILRYAALIAWSWSASEHLSHVQGAIERSNVREAAVVGILAIIWDVGLLVALSAAPPRAVAVATSGS
jgi:hypothetical protein